MEQSFSDVLDDYVSSRNILWNFIDEKQYPNKNNSIVPNNISLGSCSKRNLEWLEKSLENHSGQYYVPVKDMFCNFEDLELDGNLKRYGSMTTQASMSDYVNISSDFSNVEEYSNYQFHGVALPKGIAITPEMRKKYEPIRIELFRKVKMCPWYDRDLCRMENCNYAHNGFELRGWPIFTQGNPKLCPSLVLDYECKGTCYYLHNLTDVKRCKNIPPPASIKYISKKNNRMNISNVA